MATFSDYRVKPVREWLFEQGFQKVSPGFYYRQSDNQTVEIKCPQHPSDNWRATVSD